MTALRSFLLVSITAMIVGSLSLEFVGTFTPQGPPLYQADTARSFWEKGTLVPETYLQYHQHFMGLSRERNASFYQDVYSITTTGGLFPKHGMLTPVLASLFYGLFGTVGFVLFNSILAGLVAWGLFSICGEIVKHDPGIRLFFLMIAGTQLFFHINHLSYDLLGLALMLAGFGLSKKRKLLGAFMIGASIFARPVYIIVIPFVILARLMKKEGGSMPLLLGVSAAVGVYLLHNYILFGNALSTTYQNIPMYVKGAIVLQPHPFGFDLSVLLSNWSGKLFDQSHGLLLFNLSLLLAPFALVKLLKEKRPMLSVLFLGGLLNFVYLFSYPMWDVSHRGNRFALPSVFLWLIVSYCLLVSEGDKEGSK